MGAPAPRIIEKVRLVEPVSKDATASLIMRDAVVLFG